MILPRRTYYIGDPCYIFESSKWSDVLDLTGCFGIDHSDSWDEGMFEFDNRKCFAHHTQYGDGCYRDNFGNKYYVDSGTLAAIPISLCIEPKILSGFCFVTFQNDVPVKYVDGIFYIGTIVIPT